MTISSLFPVLTALALPIIAYCVWSAISKARTPQGAVAWAVFLVSAPWFALPAFAVFGRHKLRNYEAAWRHSHRHVEAFSTTGPSAASPASKRGALKGLERIGGLPFVAGNEVRLLIDGTATFDAILAAIGTAERSLCVQFYIIRDDGLGRRLGAAVADAAMRGVRTWVIYDGVGSRGLSRSWPARLREAGAEVLNPDAARGPTSRLDINFRNHRKTVIVDGHTAFVGGHNVGDKYLGLDPRFGRWRDTHVELRGPVAVQAQAVFAEDWHWASGDSLEEGLDWSLPAPRPGGQTAALVPTGPGDEADTGALMFLTAITAASRRVWIASPYFVPDAAILSALVAAAMAGKDVRLILPAMIDHYLPWLASHAYFDEVRQAGVKVFRYTDGFMHQKVVLVDDDLCAVGTANLDNRSFRLNFESMVFVAGPRPRGRWSGCWRRTWGTADP